MAKMNITAAVAEDRDVTVIHLFEEGKGRWATSSWTRLPSTASSAAFPAAGNGWPTQCPHYWSRSPE
jgi:hypothetical protein